MKRVIIVILTALEGSRFKPFIQSAKFDDYRRVIKEVGTWVEKLKNIAGGFSLFFFIDYTARGI